MIGTIKQLIPKMLELDQDKVYEVKEYREQVRRNAYYWSLIGQTSENQENMVQHRKEIVFKYLKNRAGVQYPPSQSKYRLYKYYEYQGKVN